MFNKYLPYRVRNHSGPTSPAVMRQREANSGQLDAAEARAIRGAKRRLRRMRVGGAPEGFLEEKRQQEGEKARAGRGQSAPGHPAHLSSEHGEGSAGGKWGQGGGSEGTGVWGEGDLPLSSNPNISQTPGPDLSWAFNHEHPGMRREMVRGPAQLEAGGGKGK